ncbi:MAG: type II secretion system protein GspM [Nitrospiraceae bacterium]|nr:type II secretion system protein GspM [Nitrospiraceae bacterium]
MKFETRDKRALIIGGSAAALILIYLYALSPFLADLTRKREQIPRKERDLVEIRKLREEYTELQKQLQIAQDAAAKRGPLLTEIENLTKRANLNTKIVSLKPQPGTKTDTFTESIVEIKLENITLYDIVNYVYLLEKATLRVRKLSFKPRYDNPKLLNATVLVSSAA